MAKLCARVGCDKEPEVGLCVTFPMRSERVPAQRMMIGIELCRPHAAEVTLEEFFDADRIAGFCRGIESASGAGIDRQKISIGPVERDDPDYLRLGLARDPA